MYGYGKEKREGVNWVKFLEEGTHAEVDRAGLIATGF